MAKQRRRSGFFGSPKGHLQLACYGRRGAAPARRGIKCQKSFDPRFCSRMTRLKNFAGHWPLPGAVIPAKAVTHCASHGKCAADGVDSHLRGMTVVSKESNSK